MLIKVFGIWLMATSISSLGGYDNICTIRMNATGGTGLYTIKDKTCDEVAAEINRQIKASKE